MLSIWLLEHEDSVDVFEHDFIVVCLSVKFAKVAVEVKTVVSARNQHG